MGWVYPFLRDGIYDQAVWYKKDRNKEDGFTHSRWDGI